MKEIKQLLVEILKELKQNTFAVNQLIELFKQYDTEEFLHYENLRDG